MRLCFRFIIHIVLLLVVGCHSSAAPAGSPSSRTVTIFAAASLTEAFEAVATVFEAQHTDVEIILNFAGSQTLRSQIEQGAYADIFASANQQHMNTLVLANLVETPVIFAENQLAVIVPVANPASIEELADLAKPDLKLVLAGAEVPVGRYAREALRNLENDPALGADFSDRVLANLVSGEDNVKGVLAKVQLGEADAGIVYTSDVGMAEREQLQVLPIPPEFNVTAQYLLALVSSSNQTKLAQAFVDFVLSPQGQKILFDHGLQPVSPEPVSYHSPYIPDQDS